MPKKPLLLTCTLSVVLACSSSDATPKPALAAAPVAVEPKAAMPEPAKPDDKTEDKPAAPQPAPKPPAVVLAPVPRPGPPRQAVKGPGISIVEASDGRVSLKTTTTWNEALDTTYSDCSFYLAAVPVLTTQLTAARAKLLPKMCAPTAPAKKQP